MSRGLWGRHQKIRGMPQQPRISLSNRFVTSGHAYSLRYEKEKDVHQNLSKFTKYLLVRGLPEEDVKLVSEVLRYGGAVRRSEQLDIFDKKDFLTLIRKTIDKGLTGVTNIYTQHKPLLYRTIGDMLRGKLSEEAFPFLEGTPTKERPQQILIFMIGGITFEEACCVNEINNTPPSSTNPTLGYAKILLGGTTILNSRSFLQGLKDLSKSGEIY